MHTPMTAFNNGLWHANLTSNLELKCKHENGRTSKSNYSAR